jgi:cytochrome c
MSRAHPGRIRCWTRPSLVVPLVVSLAFVLSGCTAIASSASPTPTPRVPTAPHVIDRLTAPPGVPGNPEVGRELFRSTGCAGCHTLSSGRGGPEHGASGLAGPILTNVVLRPTLAGQSIPMSPETMTRWLIDPPAVKPGTTMPSVGLTEAEAWDLTAYLYALAAAPQR